jgi:hypothetical protein
MPQPSESQPPVLLWILIAAGIFWWSQSGPATPVVPVPPKPDDQHEPDSPPVVNIAEAEYWSAIATCVERNSFGTLQQHTDHLLQIVDILKASGSITDDSRVAEWRAKRTEITTTNRLAIASILRGK